MRLLIVDNYDSFTYNLFHLAADVFETTPVVVRNDEDWGTLARERFDAAIISPGPGRPERAKDFGISSLVLTELEIPVLGVCLGHQGICHVAGGAVIRAPHPMHGRSSPIYHDRSGLFQGLPNPFQAVRYHSLICAEPLPGCLTKTAWTKDGLVMGLAHQSRAQWGVQFHPESICTEHGRRLMRNFRSLVGPRQPHSRSPKAVPPPPPPANQRLFIHRMAINMEHDQLFHSLFGQEPFSFWLDSSLSDGTDARFSFMGGYSEKDAQIVRYFAHSRRLETGSIHALDSTTGDLFEFLKTRLAEGPVDSQDLPFDFTSGFVGYFAYELKELTGSPCSHRSDHPDAYGLFVDRFIAIDHLNAELYMVFRGGAESAAEADECFAGWSSTLRKAAGALPEELPAETRSAVRPSLSESQYLERIERCLEAIADGETYEVCLTNRLSVETSVDPFQYYRRLRKRNPAPYSAFLRFPELSVACSSPERFLKVSRSGAAESRPIKGTSARSPIPAEDEILRCRLAEDEKSQAENLMIVDLLRNDLGRVCEVGSVAVPKLMHVETYATVHQLVSTITGRLRPGETAVDCLRALFPGGSMTGAPKIRTMEILDALEDHVRGVYSGAIGFLSANGTADWNIVIRTAVFSEGVATIGAGGAIVALSDPQEEWQELLLKANALLQ